MDSPGLNQWLELLGEINPQPPPNSKDIHGIAQWLGCTVVRARKKMANGLRARFNMVRCGGKCYYVPKAKAG